MTSVAAEEFLPVELVFNPNWWYHTAGISFDAPFYLDAQTRIQNDVIMRRVLYERYGEFGEVIVEAASVARRCPMLSSTCASVRCACSGVPPGRWLRTQRSCCWLPARWSRPACVASTWTMARPTTTSLPCSRSCSVIEDTGRRMNSRERLLTALNHQEPDRVPLDPRTSSPCGRRCRSTGCIRGLVGA